MVRCPICTNVLQLYVLAPKQTSCYYCGARWIQRGQEQIDVLWSEALHPSSSSEPDDD